MNLNQISKQLAREAKANPKKAALLGIIALVGAYLWVPLLMPSRDDSNLPPTLSSPGTGASAPSQAPASTSVSSATPSAARAIVSARWQDLLKWIESDTRTSVAGIDLDRLTRRNPFAPPAEPPSPEPTTSELTEQEPVAIDNDTAPEALGVVLTSTIVGPQRRVALINGRVYPEGAAIELDQGATFVIVQIQPRQVIVEREGRRFELNIARPATSGRVAVRKE